MAATGTATISFGASGSKESSVVITGQSGIVAGSLVEAWVRMVANGSTTADEARIEDMKVIAGAISSGVGFTIFADVLRGKAYNDYTVNWAWA